MGIIIDCATTFLACGLIATCYVGSLYVWKYDKKESTTHPNVMKKRFISVISATIVSPFIAYPFIPGDLLKNHSIWEILGLRWEGLLIAITVPLFLTAVLFLGPLAMEHSSGIWSIYREPTYWFAILTQVRNLRDYVIAPITEEFVFRACIIALIGNCLDMTGTIIVCPLFFGAAHLHHAYEQIRAGVDPNRAIKISLFQFVYTSIFGAYSAYLFLRTGHLIAPIIVHSFCNHMGFPDFGCVMQLEQPKRFFIMVTYVVGLLGWIYLLQPLTTPSLYSNGLPWAVES